MFLLFFVKLKICVNLARRLVIKTSHNLKAFSCVEEENWIKNLSFKSKICTLRLWKQFIIKLKVQSQSISVQIQDSKYSIPNPSKKGLWLTLKSSGPPPPPITQNVKIQWFGMVWNVLFCEFFCMVWTGLMFDLVLFGLVRYGLAFWLGLVWVGFNMDWIDGCRWKF